MRVLVVNPNTTASMTETIAAAARAVVAARVLCCPAVKDYSGLLAPFAPRTYAS